MALKDFLARGALNATAFLVSKGASLPAFDTTGSGARTSDIRGVAGGHTNAHLMGSGSLLRRQSRDAVRRNALASQAVDRYVSNTIGTGIRPRSTHPDQKKRDEINDLWRRFVDESDAAGLSNFYGQQVMALRSMLEGGDCFGRLRARLPEDGLTVPLQVELLEAEMVPLERTLAFSSGGSIRCGVEFNAIQRRVAYHVLPAHPEDLVSSGFGGGQTVRVPADRMFHVFRPLRPGQVRGVPNLGNVLLRLYEMDKFTDATLGKQQLAAMLTGFIKKQYNPTPTLGTGLGGEKDSLDPTLEIMRVTPGTFSVLAEGEEPSFVQPPDIGAGVDDFMRRELQGIAAGAGVTYEQLTGDLSQVNYSSIRAGLLEFRRSVEQFQNCFFIFQFCRPVWREFITSAVLSGALDAPDFLKNQQHYFGVRWVPQGFKWTDPVREVSGLILAIRAGLISRSEAIQMSGYDPEVVDAQLAEDVARSNFYGLVSDSNPAQTSKAGVTNARPAGTVLPDPYTAEGKNKNDDVGVDPAQDDNLDDVIDTTTNDGA